MSEQLPAPEFDSQNYERPNQKWICGRAAEGKPCRPGPSGRGRCQATFECAPALEKKEGEAKGRWRCTRPGGVCETGPFPDGTCCRPIPKCSPVATLRTRRGHLTLGVVTATVAVLLILLGSPPLRTKFINPGELSTPHSSDAFAKHARSNRVDQTCGACHTAGALGPSGMTAAAFHASPGPLEIIRLAHARPAEMTAIDESCQRCHTEHVFHQPNVVRDISCSFCHAEHHGAGPMPSTTDAHCTFCHGDAAVMAAAAAKGAGLPPDVFHSRVLPGQNVFQTSRPASGFTRVIHRFAGDHPEFRVHADRLRDPDTLRFNHALHLAGETIPKLTSGQSVDCAFCHQPEAAGVYFQRIQFENHCQVCHSLQFDPETPGLTLPHGNPEFVSAFLHSLPRQYADYAARSGMTRAEEQQQFAREKLQRLQARVTTGEDLEKRVFFSTATSGPETRLGSVSGPTHSLYPGCAYCHEVKPGAQRKAEITKPILFERWLPRGKFTHAKHSGVACTQCHQAATSKDTGDIILPTQRSCVGCHSASGGVSDSCATCHIYHKSHQQIGDR